MNRLFKSSLVRSVLLIGLLGGLLILQTPHQSSAVCSDILIVFVRGSSQPDDQPGTTGFNATTPGLNEVSTFFSNISQTIASWIPVEKINLPGLGGKSPTLFSGTFQKFNPNGYRAVGAFDLAGAVHETRLP